jgi:hypothetical protein
LATCLGSKHDAENRNEDLVTISKLNVPSMNELGCSVIENSEDSHLDELCETECHAYNMALSDCDLDRSIQKSFIVSDNLVRVPERCHCPIVEDCITC